MEVKMDLVDGGLYTAVRFPPTTQRKTPLDVGTWSEMKKIPERDATIRADKENKDS